eukprot:gene24090-9664_t
MPMFALNSYATNLRGANPICCRKMRARLIVRASTGTSGPSSRKVVGMGSCGVDYLASIAQFPKPDDKLRTEKLEVQGGGNCANALTAVARLGLSPYLITKIGDDGLGDGILRATGHPSPFTYIIVDRTGGTRTCIHTPGDNLSPDELLSEDLDAALDGAVLAYFDGRLTEAALKVAARAKAKGVPMLVEGERLRPALDDLLVQGDYVVTSAHFPQDWTGEAELADAILATFARLPKAQFLITTLGTKGCVMLERPTGSSTDGATKELSGVIDKLQLKCSTIAETPGDKADCVSQSGVEIRAGQVAASEGYLNLAFSSGRAAETAQAQAEAAASRAAALNADSGNSKGYAMGSSSAPEAGLLVAKVTVASIASMPKGSVVDTTGAGDAFIGSVVYGLATGMPMPQVLKLAAVVAACKCTALGARPGLPMKDALNPSLFE